MNTHTLSYSFRPVLLTIVFAVSVLRISGAAELPEVLSLEVFLEAAAARAPDVLQADLSLESVRQQFAQSLSRTGLAVAGSGSIGHSEKGSVATSGSQTPIRTSLQATLPSGRITAGGNHSLIYNTPFDQSTALSLSGTYELWDGYPPGGRSKAQLEQAKVTLSRGEVTRQSSVRDVLYRVRQSYFQTLSSQRIVALREATVAQRAEEQRRTRLLFEVGKATGIDSAQAALNNRTALVDLESARSTYRTARAKLSVLVGWPRDREYLLAEGPAAAFDGADRMVADPASLIAEAWLNRPELVQFARTEASSLLASELLQSQKSFKVSANADASWTKRWSGSSIIDWSAGVTVSVPVTDAGLLDAQIRDERIKQQVNELRRLQTMENIAIEIEENLAAMENLIERLALADDAFKLADERHTLMRTRFEGGLVSTLDVLDASVKRNTALVDRARAASDLELAALKLEYSLGR